MKSLKLSNGLVELKTHELELISAGDGLLFRFGKIVHNGFCRLRDWANEYEGDPFIRRKMGGL
jgi:hypothetical protein